MCHERKRGKKRCWEVDRYFNFLFYFANDVGSFFIGDKEYWSKGYGTAATKLMVTYGLNEAALQSIYLDVKKDNISAIKAYQKSGFSDVYEYDNYQRMAIYATDAIKKVHKNEF